MNTKLATIALVILGSIVFYKIGLHHTAFAADGMDPDWDAAVNDRDTTKPTVVFFTETWCPYCQELARDVLAQPEMQDYLNRHYNFHTVELTTPTGSARAHEFGVNVFPTLIRYDTKGRETGRIHNSTEEQVLAWLKAGE